MFARVLALLPVALLVSASHLEARDQCDTGDIYCCNSTYTVDQTGEMLKWFGLADVAAQVGALVGVQCSPVTVIGEGSACKADQQSVCCEDNKFNGLINFGCSAVNFSG